MLMLRDRIMLLLLVRVRLINLDYKETKSALFLLLTEQNLAMDTA